MTFLLSVVNYIGSLYVPQRSSEDLREAAFSAACGPLPMTPQSVQGLLLLVSAAMGEMQFDYQNHWTDRAISMAMAIGMQHRAFADSASDAVQAECYRRVFWGLYFQDCTSESRVGAKGTSLRQGAFDVDLPCEEWEYDAGIIPPPISLAQYDLQNNLGSGEFSSWTYLIDMARISSNLILPYHAAPNEKKTELFERADALICDWLIRVPQWKMDLVDAGGVADMILFHAMAFAQQNRLRIRQCASRQGLNLRQCFPLGPAMGPHRQAQKVKGFGWSAMPVEVQAANSVCSLFRQSFPIRNLSPRCLPGLLRVSLAYLDACVFLGLDTPAFREKLNMLLHIMTVHGEIWAISRKVAEEVREVAKEYSLIPQSPAPSSCGEMWVPGVTTGIASDDTLQTSDFDFSIFPDISHLGDWTGSQNSQAPLV
ncbi:hypothetical protein JX266_005013 [Neoarthrinium moseri]|nr:hypothetical protein JX266_005013 [Neoarthrinium moseri]